MSARLGEGEKNLRRHLISIDPISGKGIVNVERLAKINQLIWKYADRKQGRGVKWPTVPASRYCDIFRCRVLMGNTYSEIGIKWGISHGQIRENHERTLRILSDRINSPKLHGIFWGLYL